MARTFKRRGLVGRFRSLGWLLVLGLFAGAVAGCNDSKSKHGVAPFEVQEGAFALRDGDSVTALSFSKQLPGLLFALEQGGRVRALDIEATTVSAVREVELAPLDGSGFPTAAAALVLDEVTLNQKVAGFATSTGTANDGTSRHALYLFDASAPGNTTPSAVFDLQTIQISATGLQTSTGTADPVFRPSDPGAQALCVVGDMVYVGCANLMPQSYLDNYPGVVLGFALDPNDHTRFASGVTQPAQVVFTRGYNVTGLRAATTIEGRSVVLVTTSGAGRSFFQASPFQSSPPGVKDAFLEVLDPARGQIVAYFGFGPASARGSAAVAPDRLEAVVGRGDFGFSRGELFRVSLLDLDLALTSGGTQLMDLSGGILNGVADPIVIPFANPEQPPTGRYVSALEYSHDGSMLYAVSFNDSTLNEFALPGRGRTPVFRRQVRLSRGNETAQTFGPNASVLAVRPGVPGRDFDGADLWVGTIGVVVDPQTFTTRAEIDAIRTY